MVRHRFPSKSVKGYKSKTQVIAHNEARKVVKREMKKNAEMKAWDGQQSYTSVTPTWDDESLFTNPLAGTGLSSGNGPQNVVGDILRVVDVRVRFVLSLATVSAPSVTRITVYQIRGENPATAGDLFQQATDLVNANFDQSQVMTKGGRIKVLWDRRYTLDENSGTPSLIVGNIYIPGRKLKRRCHFDSGTPVSFDDGEIYISYVSDQNTNPPEIKWISRIRFTDS